MAGYGEKYRGDSINGGSVPMGGDYSKPRYETEKRQNWSSNKTEYLVKKVELSVHSGFSGKHRHKSPTKMEHHKDLSDGDETWRKPTSPVRHRPKFTPLSPSQWRDKTHDNKDLGNREGHNHKDFGNKLGHNRNDLRNKVGHDHDDLKNKEPPSLIDTGGWVRPNRAMWASPPNDLANKRVGILSKPTNDIAQALEYLKRASSAVPGEAPNWDKSGKTIDSREAERRYGKEKSPVRSSYSYPRGTIDSKAAARKYGGRSL